MGAGGWAQEYAQGWGRELEGLDPGGPPQRVEGGGVGPAGPLFRPHALLWAKPRGQPALLPEHPVFTLSALFGQACLSLCLTPGLLRDPLLSTSAFTTSLGSAFSRLPSPPQPCGRAALRPCAVHKPPTSLPGRPLTPTPGGPRTQAGTIAGLPSGSGYQSGPAALPGRGSPHPQQGKAMRSPRVSGPAPLQG